MAYIKLIKLDFVKRNTKRQERAFGIVTMTSLQLPISHTALPGFKF